MTDDLDSLKARIDTATPRADPERRARNIALAQQNFAALQDAPTGRGRFWAAMRNITAKLGHGRALGATGVVAAACALVLVVPFQTLPEKAVSDVDAMRAAPEAVSDLAMLETAPAQTQPAAMVLQSAVDEAPALAQVRNALMRGELPAADTVDITGLINAFPDSDTMSPRVTVMQTPWNANTRLVLVTLPRAQSLPAQDVSVQISFAPAGVFRHRQVGDAFQTTQPTPIDLGEISEGQAVTILYEVAITRSKMDHIGQVVITHRAAETGARQTMTIPITTTGPVPADARFTAAVAGFALLLRNPPFWGSWTYDDAIRLAEANRAEDPSGGKQDAIALMRLAQRLAK